jgi:hypothetical protein
MRPTGQGDSLRRPKVSKYSCGLVVTVVGLGFCSFYVRELLVSLAVFSLAFGVLTLAALAAVIFWWASETVANKTGPASRKVLAFSRRIIAAYERP